MNATRNAEGGTRKRAREHPSVYLLMVLAWLFGMCCGYRWGFIVAFCIGAAIGWVLDWRKEEGQQ